MGVCVCTQPHPFAQYLVISILHSDVNFAKYKNMIFGELAQCNFPGPLACVMIHPEQLWSNGLA